VSDQPLQLVVVLADGRHEFAIEPEAARALLADTEQASVTEYRGELQELILHYFAEGLHLHRRGSRSDLDQDSDTMVHLSDSQGGIWAIPARHILALAVVDPEAPRRPGRVFGFGSADRGRGRYANPD
jgi:hypothetical protein